MNDKIKNLISNLKPLPGVYLMYNNDNKIIYVGKAKNLFKRVSQYFLKPQVGKVMKMVSEVDHFETIITNNEKEALILEMNLIQTHYPRFNILLTDDKHYPYIAIKNDKDPYLTIKRNNKDRKYSYFGPFPNSTAAYEMVDLLNKLFPLRKCKNIPNTPCLYYHLNQCLAPCINKNIKTEEYQKLINQIKDFLNGNNKEKYDEIKNKMLGASNQNNFELAQNYKNILQSIEHINQKQNVELFDKIDRDIYAYSVRRNYLSVSILMYRRGLLLSKKSYVVEIFLNEVDTLKNIINQFYNLYPLPKEIIINNEKVIKEISQIYDCSFTSVEKGKLFELVCQAKINADNALDEYFLSARLNDDKAKLLNELGNLLKIKTPYYIELIDNSHTQGYEPVGALVAFINGEPQKKLYRKFKIEHQEARDDLQSMIEVMTRHYKRVKENNLNKPDLILLDGGLNQVKAGKTVLDNLNLLIPIFGLYKNNKHQTEGLIDYKGNTYQINDKKLFFLLTRMQDEVHRFAISYHIYKRNKAMYKSIFDGIKGLGDKRKENILKVYPDLDMLRNAKIDELKQLLPNEVAVALFSKIHNQDK